MSSSPHDSSSVLLFALASDFNPSSFAMQKPLGVMVVSQDDAAGGEAQLLKMNSLPRR